MPESLVSASEKSGLPPGSLVHVGETLEKETHIFILDYNKDSTEEKIISSVEEILPYRERQSITWVIIEGLKNVDFFDQLGRHFNIHPLVMEDILNTHQRPKFEDYDNYLFFVLKGVLLSTEEFSIDFEQISIIVTDKFVFTFKEKIDDTLHPVMKRIKNSKGQARSMGADYLGYMVIDTIVDEYFSIQDALDDFIDETEEELLTNPTSRTLATIQHLKRQINNTRRSISPLRELLNSLLRSDTGLLQKQTQIYFRDVHDHILRVYESIENYREMISSLLDIYISSISNKMNEVMKVLTVFASIFIPLTFLAGIYGMNFQYMPELKLKWAYPALWAVFILIPVILLIYFKKKKWL